MGRNRDGYIRQLPSGLWANTVRLPNGERPTETFRLESQAIAWGRAMKVDISRGDWIDPRGGKITVHEVWERWTSKRPLEKASAARDASHYRTYVKPKWGRAQIGGIYKPDIDVWWHALSKREPVPVGPASIQAALGVLRAILQSAVDARLIKYNVGALVKGPSRVAHLDRVLDDDEAELLLENAERRFPGRPYAKLFLESLLYGGFRYEEGAALLGQHIHPRRKLAHVLQVIQKDGTIKPHPKTRAGIRDVPYDDILWPRIEIRMKEVDGGAMFLAERGGPLLYDHWRDRVWLKCLTRERDMTADEIDEWKRAQFAAGKKRAWRPRWVVDEPILRNPQPTPHDLRHTYGTRLAEAGVPLHEIMALMGHEDLESVQRYLHARDGRFDRARAAMVAARLGR